MSTQASLKQKYISELKGKCFCKVNEDMYNLYVFGSAINKKEVYVNNEKGEVDDVFNLSFVFENIENGNWVIENK